MSRDDTRQALLRALPAVDAALAWPEAEGWGVRFGRGAVVAAIRATLAAARAQILSGEPASVGPEEVEATLGRQQTPGLREVLNATGVLLHTNLGRAPLAPQAIERVVAAGGAASVELDLASGGRGRREAAISSKLEALVGCEAATVVNNGAAAVLIALSALAQGREVIVSRGELVEIGGKFRVPDVIRQSGCALVEVGTTNRTRASDYQRAASPALGALLQVHRSNFSLEGFTEAASAGELAALSRALQVPLIVDLGAGLPRRADAAGPLEPAESVEATLEAGAAVVCFSGDKLLGGPQAGIIAGERGAIAAIAAHPLMRALRCDKLVLAALEATLDLYLAGRREEIPLQRMLRATLPDLGAMGGHLAMVAAELGLAAQLIHVEDRVGGGSAPGATLPGLALELSVPDPEAFAARLRAQRPALIGVLRGGAVRLHLRTLDPSALEGAEAALRGACAEGP